MRIEGADPKNLRVAKLAFSNLARRRGMPIGYRALTNGFAVLPAEQAGVLAATPVASAPAPARRGRTRCQGEGDTRGT